MELKKFVILSILISWPFSSFALTDREIRESKKCSGLFHYFEKKYQLPRDSLHAISLQETSKRHSQFKINIVWPWTVNVNGVGYHFPTKKEAIRFTKLKLAEGQSSIDVGCMQINLKYHPDAFSSVEQAFTPIKNVAYGAKFLKEKFEAQGSWQQAIGHYHSVTKEKSSNYSSSVSRIALNMENYKELLKSYSLQSSSYQTKPIEDYYNTKHARTTKPSRSNMFRSNLSNNTVAVGKIRDYNSFRKKPNR